MILKSELSMPHSQGSRMPPWKVASFISAKMSTGECKIVVFKNDTPLRSFFFEDSNADSPGVCATSRPVVKCRVTSRSTCWRTGLP